MKKYLIWPLFGLTAAFLACDQGSTTSDREEEEVVRPFTTEVADTLVSEGWIWTPEGSPYYVPQDLTIPADETLTIVAGVDVHMGPEASIYVEGKLLAVGELGNNIRFMGHSVHEDYGLWQGIVFRAGSDSTSHLSYCMVAYGSKFNNLDPEKNAAIVIDDASPTIEHCLIYLNQYNGLSLRHGALPVLHSNIVYENDGSGLSFDTSHVGNTEVIYRISDSLIVHNNFSANSSLPIRYTGTFSAMQWPLYVAGDTLVNDTLAFGVDVLGEEEGSNLYRRNSNNDKVDYYGNSIEDAFFDELSADFQSFNSCSPCIQAAFDFDGPYRADVGPILYVEAENELRKRLKVTDLSGATYTVTCDAFSHDPVSITNATVEFAGYYGMDFDGGLTVQGSSFGPTADRDFLAAWKSLRVLGHAGGTALIENCTFRQGSESSFSGQDWINAGGMLELRDGAICEVYDCDFFDGNNHGVSAHGAGALAYVEGCNFEGIGLSAFYLADGARGKIATSTILGCGSYGVFLYNTGYFAQVENNLIAGGSQYGVKLQASLDAQVIQNTIVDNLYGGIKLSDNSDPEIRYNLIADNDYYDSDIATGIVGNTIGAVNDANNPTINVNWFSGNGGEDAAAFPGNWTIGDCNEYTDVSLPGDYQFDEEIPDCENGGVMHAVGWAGEGGAVDNPGPMLASIGDIDVLEDGQFEVLLGAISYEEDPVFSYEVVCDTDSIEVLLEDDLLILTPVPNWNGSAVLTVTMSDGVGGDAETFVCTVVPVNDPPVLSPIGDHSILLGEIDLDIDLEATDIDNTSFDFSAELFFLREDDYGRVTADISGSSLTLTPEVDWVGEVDVMVTVSDEDELDPQTDSETFTFSVLEE